MAIIRSAVPSSAPHELIGAVTRQQMLDWRNRNYWGSRIVVAAAGNIDHKAFAAEAERLLGHRAGP